MDNILEFLVTLYALLLIVLFNGLLLAWWIILLSPVLFLLAGLFYGLRKALMFLLVR